jgi:hypothetical protein
MNDALATELELEPMANRSARPRLVLQRRVQRLVTRTRARIHI